MIAKLEQENKTLRRKIQDMHECSIATIGAYQKEIEELKKEIARLNNINPAQLLAQKPRKRSPEAVEQSRQAASKPRPNAKGKPKETFCKVCGKAIMVKGSKGCCDEHRPTSTPQ